MTERRVGIWTLGVSLVGFGVLFLLHTCWGMVDYRMAMRFWPLVFILLGVEVIVQAVRAREVRIRLDILSVVIILLFLIFAGAMVGMEMTAAYYCL